MPSSHLQKTINDSLSSAIPSEEIQSDSWQKSLSHAIRSPEELLEKLKLDIGQFDIPKEAFNNFLLLVTESYLNRMERGNPKDPLLLQVLPTGKELVSPPGFTEDALHEKDSHFARGLLKKYHHRALMITTGTCAIHCRYCFRRHFSYLDEPRQWEDWKPAFEAIEKDSSIQEILLSGGDPLILNDSRLEKIIKRLEEIPHIKRIRIHTRIPVVLPSRITSNFLELFLNSRLTTFMVIHANHHHELRDDAAESIRKIVRSGIPVLNQAVLLKGINDSKEEQFQLCEGLINLGVIPYYLHQLDQVEGTSHFETEETLGKEIIQFLRENLPGYAVPQYVREIPGKMNKTPLL